MTEKEKKGFKVVDRRKIGRENPAGEDPDEAPPTVKESQPGTESSGEVLPGLTGLFLSLHTSTLGALGLAGEEGEERKEPDLTSARQLIDILEALNVKTSGNLEKAEEDLLKESLYQLQMIYVKLSEEDANN
jgi:hypothetical protein